MKAFHWLILSLTVILAAGFATPAAAGPPTARCADQLSNLTIHGDLIVPDGERCQLVGVTVTGDLRVRQRATLEVIQSRIDGTLTGTGFEHVSLREANVGKRIRLVGGVSTEIERTTVAGDTRLIDHIDARVLQSRVIGTLVVRGAREVALICGTTVGGNARFADHHGGLLIGDDPTGTVSCGANQVLGSVLVHHNRSDTVVANTVVGRNLICAANEPAPLVYGNQVSGAARGQCGAGEPVGLAELGTDAE